MSAVSPMFRVTVVRIKNKLIHLIFLEDPWVLSEQGLKLERLSENTGRKT